MIFSETRPVLYLAVAALLLVLSGCAGFAPGQRDGLAAERLWEARQASLAGMNWVLSGRVAVKSGSGSWQARLSWRQVDEHYAINFQSPFGQLLARLMGDDSGVSLYLPDDQVLTSEDPRKLLREQLGWEVPVAGLRKWVTGVPAEGDISAKSIDGKGRLLRLDQQGWSIDFARYVSIQDLDMPGKVRLERDDVSIRLVIDRWELQVKNNGLAGKET